MNRCELSAQQYLVFSSEEWWQKHRDIRCRAPGGQHMGADNTRHVGSHGACSEKARGKALTGRWSC
jgi:hypothetical protein